MTSLMNRPGLFGQMTPLREAIDSLFEQSFLSPSWRTLGGAIANPAVALDIYEDEENYYVLGVLPGVDPNKVDIVAQENTLTISGEIPHFVPEGKRVVWQELPAGNFRRSLTLPTPFDSNNVQAQYDGGLLKLVVPKAEHVRVRRIQIGSPTRQEQLGNGHGNK